MTVPRSILKSLGYEIEVHLYCGHCFLFQIAVLVLRFIAREMSEDGIFLKHNTIHLLGSRIERDMPA